MAGTVQFYLLQAKGASIDVRVPAEEKTMSNKIKM